jgi:hypothetical protein
MPIAERAVRAILLHAAVHPARMHNPSSATSLLATLSGQFCAGQLIWWCKHHRRKW